MEEILLLALVGALNIICFVQGAKVGQAVRKDEPVNLPTVNPLQIVREHREKKAAELEQERIDTIMRNIEAYDGTASGQDDVPGR